MDVVSRFDEIRVVLNPDDDAVPLAVLDALPDIVRHPFGDFLPTIAFGLSRFLVGGEDSEDRRAHLSSDFDPFLNVPHIVGSRGLVGTTEVVPDPCPADVET